MNAPSETPSRAAAAVQWVSRTFDGRDAFFFGGLLVAAIGGFMLSPARTLIAVGAVLALKGNGPIFPIRRGE